MDPLVWILILVVLVVIAVAAWWFVRQRQRTQLRERFGPEYDRAVREHGNPRRAESALKEREKQVEQLEIRPLSPVDHARFTEAWRATQARFVDDPTGAVTEADRLVAEVMRTRGYPVGNFEERAALISVDHANVVTNYRAARRIAQANERGEASTEDLRQAVVHYRALFEDLLQTDETQQREARR